MEMTVRNGTQTSEGFIGHRRHGGGFDMPVALDVNRGSVKDVKSLQRPLRDSRGRLLFVVPGGSFRPA